jgi:hypothetical protein
MPKIETYLNLLEKNALRRDILLMLYSIQNSSLTPKKLRKGLESYGHNVTIDAIYDAVNNLKKKEWIDITVAPKAPKTRGRPPNQYSISKKFLQEYNEKTGVIGSKFHSYKSKNGKIWP